MITGLDPSFAHNQNGMTLDDMRACERTADRLDEVIIFRSTGPWSKRWLEDNHPSKNFHVKGKSSDWGPHAGLVPFDGVYSKVGAEADKAAKGTKANQDGLDSGFASRGVLILNDSLLKQQLTRPEGDPSRTALASKVALNGSPDFLLTANRSGDGKVFVFRAVKVAAGYEIHVYPPAANISSPFIAADRDPSGARAVPLLVMTSSEVGALNKAMTGDYDLLSVCPSWAMYGSQAPADIAKAAIALTGGHGHGPAPKSQEFSLGVGMDNVMDARLHTHGTKKWHDFGARKTQYQTAMRSGRLVNADSRQLATQANTWEEHGDMGNLTPRILRCINELNAQMGAVGANSPFRRVHHNAESHRNLAFGALTEKDLTTIKNGEKYGDGFPFTVFQPTPLTLGAKTTAGYGKVATIENLTEFRLYCTALKAAGYVVPKHMAWG
jgi:hypothetical protein